MKSKPGLSFCRVVVKRITHSEENDPLKENWTYNWEESIRMQLSALHVNTHISMLSGAGESYLN